jgi:hypothetical protein
MIGFSGCVDSGSGTASICVKDAPTEEFDEIDVVFSSVQIRKSGDNSTSGGPSSRTQRAKTSTCSTPAGPRSAFLGEANMTAGKYQQIRVRVLRAYGVTDGNETDSSCPAAP